MIAVDGLLVKKSCCELLLDFSGLQYFVVNNSLLVMAGRRSF